LQKQKESQNTRFCRSGRQNITLKKLQKLQKYQIAEVEGKSKYQILQKRKTKYHSNFFFCRNWTQIPNCRNWREDEILKQLQRQNRNTKLQKLKESWNTRFCRSGRQNITLKQFVEIERKYQITKTEEKMKYQNNYRDITKIPNCRS
jgi:hypothetical protein